MTAVDRIDELIGLLDHVGACFAESVKDVAQDDDPPAIAFQRVFEFSSRTLRSAATVLAQHRDVLSAATLIRPVFEITARILWAARESGGWQRLPAYYAKEERKWAAEAVAFPAFRAIAKHVQLLADSVLARVDPSGETIQPMPTKLEDILTQIESHDIKDGYADNSTDHPRFQYTNVYRMLCRPAHGNVFSIVDGVTQPDLRHVVVAAGLGVFALTRAACAVGAEDERAETEALATRIGQLIGGSRNISLDDLPPPDEK